MEFIDKFKKIPDGLRTEKKNPSTIRWEFWTFQMGLTTTESVVN